MGPALTDDEYRDFSAWIAREYGLRFGPEKRDMLRARLEIRRRALGFASFRDLLNCLEFGPDRDREANRLVPHLTNNESYFFRESGQFEVFASTVLDELRRARGDSNGGDVRVLSAACAAGEEAYSLAMIGKQAGARLRVTGMDVDDTVLDRAGVAEYTAHAFRGVSTELRERHFDPLEAGRWRVRQPIRGRVSFVSGNLLDPSWPGRLPTQDAIFCRNVLIYFDPAATERAVRLLRSALREGGYLFLGHAESLRRVPHHGFTTVRRPGAVFYRKDGD